MKKLKKKKFLIVGDRVGLRVTIQKNNHGLSVINCTMTTFSY